MAAGAGTGVRGAGVVAERTWAEHQKRCIFPYGPYRLSRGWFRFGSQRTVYFFLKGNMYGKLGRENIVAGLMTSHESKSFEQKNV